MLKRFNFFEKEEITDIKFPGKTKVTAATCLETDGNLLLGDADGKITVYSSSYELIVRLSAHDGEIKHLKLLKENQFISVAEVELKTTNELQNSTAETVSLIKDTEVKFWEFEKDSFNIPSAKLIHSISLRETLAKENSKQKEFKLFDEIKTWPAVNCVEILPNCTHIALGLNNGLTFLLRSSNLLKSHALEILPPPHYSNQTVENSTEASGPGSICLKLSTMAFNQGKTKLPEITGLGFLEEAHSSSNSIKVYLWIASTAALRSLECTLFNRTGRVNLSWPLGDSRLAPVKFGPILDNEGCEKNCCCIGFPSTTSKLTLNMTSGQSSSNEQDTEKLKEIETVFILGQSDRAAYFTADHPGSCYAVSGRKRFIRWFAGYLVVVSDGGNIDIAKSQLRKEVLNLYDFQNKFISLNFPFRDDDMGHVMHIVNCFSRLLIITTTNKIYQFMEKDIDTKLRDLLKRNLYSTAISLAQVSNCSYASVLDIYRMYADHLYLKGNYDEAMSNFIKTIGYVEPSYVIRKFLDSQNIGNLTTYIEQLHLHPDIKPTSDHTTLLLNCYIKQMLQDKLREFVRNTEITRSIDVRSAIAVLLKGSFFQEALCLAENRGEHDEYLKIQIDILSANEKAKDYIKSLESHVAAKFLKKYGKTLMESDPDEITSLIKRICTKRWVYENSIGNEEVKSDLGPSELQFEENQEEEEKINPENFIKAFADHPDKLIEFLRHITEFNPNLESDTVWSTLLELSLIEYSKLRQMEEAPTETIAKLEEDVMAILNRPSTGNNEYNALVLVQEHDFKAGQLYLYEKLGMFNMLLQHYMESGDNLAIISKCKTYGGNDPNLWAQVLTHFAQSEGDCTDEIRQVLNHIERLDILPPSLVIQILATNDSLPLSTARTYIISQINKSSEIIEEDDKEITQLLAETDRMRKEIEQLETKPKTFTSTKCNLTGAPLELPTVHFLSGNSYNLNSLDTSGGAGSKLEDPKCASDQHAVSDIIAGLRRLKSEGVDEEFFRQLELSRDGFETISEYFGKCLFDK